MLILCRDAAEGKQHHLLFVCLVSVRSFTVRWLLREPELFDKCLHSWLSELRKITLEEDVSARDSVGFVNVNLKV